MKEKLKCECIGERRNEHFRIWPLELTITPFVVAFWEGKGAKNAQLQQLGNSEKKNKNTVNHIKNGKIAGSNF